MDYVVFIADSEDTYFITIFLCVFDSLFTSYAQSVHCARLDLGACG
jgi:hypothetical protein